MKKTVLVILSVLCICALSVTLVWAADAKKDAVIIDKKDKSELSKKADLFLKVVSYGEAEKDPMVMLSAVKIFDTLPFKSVVKPGEKGKEGTRYDRDGILKQAKEFAAGDVELLALIAKVQDAPEKTEVRGHHDRFGHGGGYYGGHYYYERRHHQRRYDCDWHLTRHGDWICR